MKRLAFIIIFLLPFVTRSQTISTVAGNGLSGNTGDNGSATLARIGDPTGIAFDKKGNLYISSPLGYKVRKVNPLGIITTFAGIGISGYSGDNGPATAAKLGYPTYLATDTIGNVYISDASNWRIRKIDTLGIISTFAGNGTSGYSGDNVQATTTSIYTPQGINFDKNGNLFIADYNNHRIRKVDVNGIITTFAGMGIMGFSGDGGMATSAKLNSPMSVACDASGNVYIADFQNNRVRKVDLSGSISTIIGNGSVTYNGEGLMSTSAQLSAWQIAIDDSDNIFVADASNERIRKISALTGLTNTISGTGTGGYSGDGIPAVTAEIYSPEGLAFDKCQNIFIADLNNFRIRKVTFNPTCNPSSLNTDVADVPENISIYPNPVNQNLQIENAQPNTQYEICNLVGELQQQGNLKQGNNTIALKHLPLGMYMLVLTDDEGRKIVKKIIKE